MLRQFLIQCFQYVVTLNQLELIISVDTSVAHLAGALGKPLWLLNRYNNNDWRWQLDRADSPWYPGMRIFRQKKWNDWPGLLREVAIELGRMIAR
jgi:hypothetical protein